MMVPPMQMDGRHRRRLPDQTSLAPVALAIFMPSSKLAFHSATASSSKLWVILPSGMPNSSLSLASSMRFSIFGISSPKAVMRVIAARGALHEGGQVGAEQVDARIGEAAEAL